MILLTKYKRPLCIAFFILFIAMQTHAHADTASFNFDEVVLSDLAQGLFVKELHKNFIADDEFIHDKSKVTLSIKDKSLAELELIVIDSIRARGYNVTVTDETINIKRQSLGFNNLQPTISSQLSPSHSPVSFPKEDQSFFYYKMLNRDLAYFSSMLQHLYPEGRFSFESDSEDVGAFVFKGTESEISDLKGLLPQIDTKVDQAQINAYMLEVSDTKRKETAFGLALNLLGSALKINVAAQMLGNIISLKTNNFNLALSALNQDTRFNIVSSPSIFVKDRQQGRISVGADVPVLSQVSFQQNGTPVQSVEYKPSGVILDIKPRFLDENIELTIHHQLSSFTPTTTGVNGSPTLIKREFSSVINAQNEDIILIGGLAEIKLDKNRVTNPLFPFLSSSNTSRTEKSELILMLHVKRI